MAVPWASLAMIGGGLLAENKLNPKYNFTPPPKDIQISDQDVNGIFGQILGDLNMTNADEIAGIKQVGAANRLPAGATQGRIAELGQRTARGAARALPQLKENQRRSKMDYYNLLKQYELLDANEQNASSAFKQSSLGALGRVITLWQGGAFDKPNWNFGTPGGESGTPGMGLGQFGYQKQPYDLELGMVG